jgi:hypothetical protein
MFSSRHYEAIAKLVKELPQGVQWVPNVGWVPLVTLSDVTYDLIGLFVQDNKGFNKDKFLKACGRQSWPGVR